MNKIIFALIISLFTNVCIADIDLKSTFADYSKTKIKNSDTKIVLSLPNYLKTNILKRVNKNFLKMEIQNHKDKDYEYNIHSEIYFTISEAILICHTQSKYGDTDCLTNELRKNVDESTIKMIVNNYASSIDVNSHLAERIKNDLYFINYYYFMSKIFS
ncbi:MAG: hypothetical protein Q8M44_00390, partial [bacterium]|nr:hypothetical protein [bacterium]